MPTVKSLCNLARQSIKAGAFDQAIDLARHVLRHYPKSIEAHCVLGEACSERGDIGEAGRYFKLVLSADPENVTALVGLGVSYRDQGGAEGGLILFERTLETQPDNARLRREILRLSTLHDDVPRDRIKPTRGSLGHIYLQSGLFAKAAKEFRSVFEADPARLDAATGLVESLWRAGLYVEAAQASRSVLSVAPDGLKARLVLAEMCFAGLVQGDPRAMMAEAQGLDPDNRMASDLFAGTPAAAHWALQPTELPLPGERGLDAELAAWAEVDVEPAADEAPGEAAASLSVEEAVSPEANEEPAGAEMASMRHQSEAELRVAIDRVRSLLVREPENHAARLSLAVALGRLRDIDRAGKEFEHLISTAPDLLRQVISGLKELLGDGVDHPRLRRLLADAYLKDGAFIEAVEQYALALEKEAKR